VGEIKRQGIINTIISYTGIVIGFIYTIVLLPTFLSPEEVGLTRVLYAVSLIFGTLFPFGLGSFTIKFFPRFKNPINGHNGYLKLLLLSSTILYLLSSSLAYLFKNQILAFYDNSHLLQEFFVFVFPVSLAIGFISMINVYCLGLFKSSFPAFLNEVYIRIANIAAISLYFLQVISFNTFIVIYSLGFLSQLLLMLIYVVKIDKGLFYPINWEHFKNQNKPEMLNYILLIAPASLASMALRQIDVSMLGSNLNGHEALADVAVYTIGFTIGSIIETPFNALAKITDSKISDAFHRNDMRMIEDVYTKSTRVLMMFGGLLLVGICFNIDSLLGFLPPKYAESSAVIVIIGVSCFVNMATGLNSSIIYYSDRYKHGSILLIGLIVSSVVLNYIFIPLYGIEGAAIATGSALLLFNIFKSAIIYNRFKIQPFGTYIFAVLFAIFLSGLAAFYLPKAGNSLFDIAIRSSLITVIYAIVIIASKKFPEVDGFIKKWVMKNAQ
jgi:O-antigen/teichoic acid export membrane protein